MSDHGTVRGVKIVKKFRLGGPSFLLCVFIALLWLFNVVVSEEIDTEAGKLPSNKTDKGVFNPILDPILALFQRRENDDAVEDSFYDPLQPDADCDNTSDAEACRWSPPDSTIETMSIDATCSYGGADPDEQTCKANGDATTNVVIDKHWGSDPTILRIRDQLRQTGSGCSTNVTSDGVVSNRRPPIFLMPGLASTRLVAWRFKSCPSHPLLSDIKVQDYVWLNINLIMQMSTIDVSCMRECLKLGRNQTDTDDLKTGCKLRPDEGLDAISSLSPGGIGSQLLVGGTNTVYAWLIQWCADNMGYDVSNIIGLPYDWRLSPDKMEQRDGFLTLTRRRIEAAVQTNGEPGIVVAHSMGNIIFRYFLSWMRKELREEAYHRFVRKAERRAKAVDQKQQQSGPDQLLNQTEKKPAFVNSVTIEEILESKSRGVRNEKLWKLAQWEGDTNWYEWVETHIWTYVGLSAPLLGAVNPLRAVISGENMGLPVTDPDARVMELTFGSTHTVNPISSKNGFCDQWDINDRWDEEPSKSDAKQHEDSKLACLDDILTEIELSIDDKYYNADPWEKFPALKRLLRDRSDWDSDLPMIRVIQETCDEKERRPCAKNSTLDFGPKDIETGRVFTEFDKIWNEPDHPLIVKLEQLRESFWDTDIPNMLNETWERPLIKHVIMAYGVDIPTEIGYEYLKTERITADKKDATKSDIFPNIHTAYWETAGGAISTEHFEQPKSNILTDFWKKKQKREPLREGKWRHSGDGSVPYLSLAWSHTWLLHAVRARRYSGKMDGNPLDDIEIRHRPEGATEWVDGPPPKRIAPLLGEKKVEESSDTGTAHPHGTKYKPEMVRYHNVGISRTTGIEYTTTVIEAISVEHKETTRNYDILAAVFSDILKFMHDDLNII